jgi:hypothetical protein
MISVNQKVTDAFNKSYSVNANIGALIDINCNTLINFNDDDLTGNAYQVIANKEPFKKLFPLDTIVKSFRPVNSGIKYAISGDIPTNSWTSPKDTNYLPKLSNGTEITYRTYYPSKDVYYKYFITPLNQNASVSIRYYNASAPVGETNKRVPCNKIVFKFETGHATPTSWSILINGTDVTGSLVKTVPASGVVEIYYNGTSWSRNKSDLNTNASVSVSTLGMTAVNPGGYIGVIELAPHWVRDLTNNLVSMSITKESSSSSEDILPVGSLTANSLDLSLNGYNQEGMIFKTYSKQSSEEIDTDYLYFSKHAEVDAFFKLYDSSGDNEDTAGKYFKIPQGTFIVDNWSFSEHGEASLFALDYAKVLQETICPDIVCDGYSAVAIIRRILDSIGFTNYNFNYTSDDKSIITPDYWWSDSTQTAWSLLQEICRDTQMSASVDENNVLQFYSRDYMFNKDRAISWTFRDKPEVSGELPNIISMDLKELPSVNQVRVLYSSAYITTYEQSAKELLSVDNTSLISASLQSNLDLVDNTTKSSWTDSQKWITLRPVYVIQSQLSNMNVISEFSGYLLLNSEIIEYDAIEYEYVTAVNDVVDGQSYTAGAKVKVAITGPNDIAKYRGRARTAADQNSNSVITTFNPTHRYRIKTRGAFGTKPGKHTANLNYDKNGWKGYANVTWKNK